MHGRSYAIRVRATDRRQCGQVDGRVTHLGALTGSVRRHPFAAVNLISDPVHGYIELTKRLGPAESAAAGLPAEDVAEEDLDTAWLSGCAGSSQLQSARWVFPTAEHSRFTHGLGVMHEAGLWARSLYPSLRAALAAEPRTVPSRRKGWSRRPCAWPGSYTTSRTRPVRPLLRRPGPADFDMPTLAVPTPSASRTRTWSARIVTEERRCCAACAGAGAVAERDALADGESIDPGWVAFLIAKPALADPAMPRWVRWLAPLCRACSRSTTSTTCAAMPT